MAMPFERPPHPTQADEDAETLYAAVGRALSAWEGIESELSHLYAQFIGKWGKREAYDLYYEQGKNGQSRVTTLAKAGEQYFVKHCDQKAEGDLETLIRTTRLWADRRHELAHGIVRPMQWYWPYVKDFMKPPAGPAYEWCLVPPHYQRSWFDPEKWNPEFLYTSREVGMIEHGFVEHLHLLLGFRHDYLPKRD